MQPRLIHHLTNTLSNNSRNFSYGSTVRIPILADDIYLVRGVANVAAFFHETNFTVMKPYGIVLGDWFGMHRRALRAYSADTTGSRQKPLPESLAGGKKWNEEDRISLNTHKVLTAGLMPREEGPDPTAARFEKYLRESIADAVPSDDEWIEEPDLKAFFETHVSASVLQAVFGEGLLATCPGLVQDLWKLDVSIVDMSRRYPRFWIPAAYRTRDKLLLEIKKWHATLGKGDKEPFDDAADMEPWPRWATKMARERYKMLKTTTAQDGDSVASTDLAFIWA